MKKAPTMRNTERVCATQPFCACGGRDPFTCNCLRRPGEKPHCANCGASLITVAAYEKMMKRAAGKPRLAKGR